MILNLEKQKEHFKEHIATFTDYGTIKILDFKKPNSSNYRIRFLFEEDYCRLHISGDLGSLVATNYNNMTYEGFTDFVHNTGYFKEKIDCIEHDIYCYDDDLARKELKERLEEYGFEPEFDFETIEDKIDEIMEDFNDRDGIGSKGYDILSEIDQDCWEYISKIGREETGILELYMLAFELAQEQLEDRREK
jgi:hypothetical protein